MLLNNARLFGGRDVLHESVIKVAGLTIVEIVAIWEVPEGGPTANTEYVKLIWIRDSIDQMQLEGRDNPCCHVDFPIPARSAIPYKMNNYREENARRRVQKAFNDYWGTNV